MDDGLMDFVDAGEFVSQQDWLEAAKKVLGENDFDDRPLAPAPEDIHPIVTGGVGIKMTHLPLWSGGTRTVTRAVRSL